MCRERIEQNSPLDCPLKLRMTRSQALSWLAALALFIATHVVYKVEFRPDSRIHDLGLESLQLANSLAFNGTFADPFQPMPTGPSAHATPGYPALVALIIRLYGNEAMGNYVLARSTIFAVALQLALLPLLAQHLGMGFTTGILASIAWLVGPVSIQLWESHYAGLLAVILAFPMFTAFRRELTWIESAGTGLSWGVLLLFNPAPILVLLVWLLVLYSYAHRSLVRSLVLLGITFLVILPWCVRNYLVFHEPIFLRDNLGLELAVSNNPCAKYSLELNERQSYCFSQNHPNENSEEAAKVRLLGEATYNHLRMKEFKVWIRENPCRFLKLTADRFLAFWFPQWAEKDVGPWSPKNPAAVVVSISTLFSLLGLLFVWRKNRNAAILLLCWLIFFPPVYYMVQFDERYRQPVLWVSLLLGSYFIKDLVVTIFQGISKAQTIRERTDGST
jgi:hypothetical protein